MKGVVGALAHDNRVLAWDIWNEPDNTNGGSYHQAEPKNKVDLVLALLPKGIRLGACSGAEQPLTSGVWKVSGPRKTWSDGRVQLEQSDVISFHNYDAPTELEKRINWLLRYNRPLICTEYMARGSGSFFIGSLPVFKRYNVAAINWGWSGKAQTHLPWDSWERPYVDREPAIWFHEVFRRTARRIFPRRLNTLSG